MPKTVLGPLHVGSHLSQIGGGLGKLGCTWNRGSRSKFVGIVLGVGTYRTCSSCLAGKCEDEALLDQISARGERAVCNLKVVGAIAIQINIYSCWCRTASRGVMASDVCRRIHDNNCTVGLRCPSQRGRAS